MNTPTDRSDLGTGARDSGPTERPATNDAVGTDADALTITDLVKRFDDFTLEGIDLQVPRGYVVGLVGANGSGKTTTIGCALGLVVPGSGTIDIPPMDRVGVVLDSHYFVPWWTPTSLENAVRPFYPRWSPERYRSLLVRFGIKTGTKIQDLSRGQTMRLQLAVALAHDPDLLILDEPTSGLDPLARDGFVDVIADFMTDESHSVLFSTHITADLEKIADHVVVLADGRVAATASTADLIEQYRLVRGGPDELTDELRATLLGLREHPVGFEGLARSGDADSWGGLVVEAPSLDQIVVGIAKGVAS
ncbi:ABC-2 type transport system ATP-binding protein [Kineosphaera limosa]|uniref:Putative ABC transporter ATP-binding protein n=1 Tax=Kineosphaera limosa NBRC 100340 TaxID=1184609 RepID=K6VHQ2_9MICO|nr:ABC transporter ATP-binding protein [Kineosphaera limosa]NYE00093.1 ABC-2 type transport system ATP-binding protein [Kineosphaera limosa]GAB95733.1 putative ABC transporter ATP-binding protein [Kineosphaera limosa NBRC 100340]